MKDWRDAFAAKVEIVIKRGVATGMRLRDRAEYESIIRENIMRCMFDAINEACFDESDIPGSARRGDAEWEAYLVGGDPEKTHFVECAFKRVMDAWPARNDHKYLLADAA